MLKRSILLATALVKLGLQLLDLVHDNVPLEVQADLLPEIFDERTVEEDEDDDVELDLALRRLRDVHAALRREDARERVDSRSKQQGQDELELEEVEPHLVHLVFKGPAIADDEYVCDAGGKHAKTDDSLEGGVASMLRHVAVQFAAGVVVQDYAP